MKHIPCVDCATCPLRSDGIFRSLDAAMVSELDRSKTVHTVTAGHDVLTQGSPSLAIHCVQTGGVRLRKTGDGGEEILLDVCGEGEILGLRAMLAGEPYEATAEALDETTICTIPRETFVSLLRRNSGFALDVMQRLAVRLRLAHERIMEVTQRTVMQRVAHLLLALLDTNGAPEDAALRSVIRTRRADMAHLVGTTPESLSRTLHALEARGLIQVKRRDIRVLDAARLRLVAREIVFA